MTNLLKFIFILYWAYAEDLKIPGVQDTAEHFPPCQDGILVEYNSPLSGHKIKMCQIKKDGRLIKQGAYWEYDHQNHVVQKSLYQNDQLSTGSTSHESESMQPVQSSISRWDYAAAGYGICALSPEKKMSCQGYLTYSPHSLPTTPLQGAIQKIDIAKIDFVAKSWADIYLIYNNKKNLGIFLRASQLFQMKTPNVLSEGQLDFKISVNDEIKSFTDGGNQVCILTVRNLINCWDLAYLRETGKLKLDHGPTNIPWPMQNGLPIKILNKHMQLDFPFICVLNDQGRIFCRAMNLKPDEDPHWENYQINFSEKVLDMSTSQDVYCFQVDAPKYFCFLGILNYKTRVTSAGPLMTVNIPHEVKQLEVSGWLQQCVLDKLGDVYCTQMSHGKLVYGPIKREFANPSQRIVLTHDLVCSEVAAGKLHCLQIDRSSTSPEIKRELDFDFTN